MNYGISVLFRAIPLLMALFCFGYGFFVFNYGVDSSRFVAGPVVFSLGFICIALFATAATIIRQIIHTYNNVARFALPILGYLSATITFLAGFILLMSSPAPADFVAGHVICGVGLDFDISYGMANWSPFKPAGVGTTPPASTRFTLIQMNAKSDDPRIPDKAFNFWQGIFLILVASFISIVAWIWAYRLLAHSDEHSQYFVAGHVMAGLACICSSLIALVATIARQIRNTYSRLEKRLWHRFVILMGSISLIWGLFVLGDSDPANASTGYIMIGLGLVCYSISSKVILLSKIWREEFKLANRIPLIPIFTALFCLFLSAFLFEMAAEHSYYAIPARVLAGLGAICFTLFSIVSILESGTSSK